MLHLVFLPFIIGTAWGHLDADREDLVEREALRTEEKGDQGQRDPEPGCGDRCQSMPQEGEEGMQGGLQVWGMWLREGLSDRPPLK